MKQASVTTAGPSQQVPYPYSRQQFPSQSRWDWRDYFVS